MRSWQRIQKAIKIFTRPGFITLLARHGVAAAVEHVEAIRLSEAGTLVDIGANKGQFSLVFRAIRPKAAIIAFEPLPDAADTYEDVLGTDPLVKLHRVAISDVVGQLEFHITDRRDSSSLLRPGHGQAAAFGVHAESVAMVPVRRLDEFLALDRLPRPVLVKIDVQGAELKVLKGFERLEDVDFVYVELSFVELYQGQPLFHVVAAYLEERGFELAGVFNQVLTVQFGPTQADFFFRQSNRISDAAV